MANTSSRTLRHLSLLQTHRYRPGAELAELAERLDVSLRTLRRSWTRTFDRATGTRQACISLRGTNGGSHQQYLYKNPNGYRCHSNTGIPSRLRPDDQVLHEPWDEDDDGQVFCLAGPGVTAPGPLT